MQSLVIKLDAYTDKDGNVKSLAYKYTKVELYLPDHLVPVAKEEEVTTADSYSQIYFNLVQPLLLE